MKPAILVLGCGGAADRTIALIGALYDEFVPVQVRFGAGERTHKHLIELELENNAMEAITTRLTQLGMSAAAVVNRYDPYIPLQGQLVDEYSLAGPSLMAVQWFKDKRKMDRLMRRLSLGKYRPKTKVMDLENLRNYLARAVLPVVVKPYMGAKSRGVFFIDNVKMIDEVVSRLEQHYDSEELFAFASAESEVLVEELLRGHQVTCTGYVDADGNLHTVGWESVLTGRDVGQAHQQLVYRTCPAENMEVDLRREAEAVLTRAVRTADLKSTFIFPDFIVDNERIYLVELNVRVGGYRSHLYSLAKGIDLDRGAIELALGNEPELKSNRSDSSTLVEVWEDRSGVVREVVLPEGEAISRATILMSQGRKYTPPPKAQEPLARYYVVDEKDSLTQAQKIREKVQINWA